MLFNLSLTSCGDAGSRWFLNILSALSRNCTSSFKLFKAIQASQNIIFSSLYSFFRKILNTFLPYWLSISLSNPLWGSPQPRISFELSSFSSSVLVSLSGLKFLWDCTVFLWDFLESLPKKLLLLCSLFFTDKCESWLCWDWKIICLSSPELMDSKEGESSSGTKICSSWTKINWGIFCIMLCDHTCDFENIEKRQPIISVSVPSRYSRLHSSEQCQNWIKLKHETKENNYFPQYLNFTWKLGRFLLRVL